MIVSGKLFLYYYITKLPLRYFSLCMKMASIDAVSSMRVDYDLGEKINMKKFKLKEPISIFEIWFNEAARTEVEFEANAMTLATSTRDGVPSCRTVLLKGFDKTGFKFFTSYESRKGRELAENPNAALTFFWPPFSRQVNIKGAVQKLTNEESTKYFHSRPRPSQISACVSNQSSVISDRQVLSDKEKELTERFAELEEIPKPDYWIRRVREEFRKETEKKRAREAFDMTGKRPESILGAFGGGYRVIPSSIEFWQGQTNRLHDRILFRKKDELIRTESSESLVNWNEGDEGWMYATLSP